MDWLSRINEIRRLEPLPEGAGVFDGVRYERLDLGPSGERRWCGDCGRSRPTGDFRGAASTCAACADRRHLRALRGNRGNGRHPRQPKLFESEV